MTKDYLTSMQKTRGTMIRRIRRIRRKKTLSTAALSFFPSFYRRPEETHSNAANYWCQSHFKETWNKFYLLLCSAQAEKLLLYCKETLSQTNLFKTKICFHFKTEEKKHVSWVGLAVTLSNLPFRGILHIFSFATLEKRKK